MALSAKTSIFGSYEFIVRRLHSLTGLVPIGGYLFIHLATNDSIMDGGPTFQSRVDQIHSLGPTTLLLVEWSFIFLPILFHGLIGLLIVTRGERNVVNYSYPENVRYTLQRWTGVIAFAFILWHVFQMHGWFRWEWWQVHVAQPLGGARFDPHNAAVTAAATLQASALMRIVYVVGVSACVYHLANGLWTIGITWGAWTSPRAQRWANIPCAAFGVLLAITGIVALWGMLTFPVPGGTTPGTPRQQTGQLPSRTEPHRTSKMGTAAASPRFPTVFAPSAARSHSPLATARVVQQAQQGAM